MQPWRIRAAVASAEAATPDGDGKFPGIVSEGSAHTVPGCSQAAE